MKKIVLASGSPRRKELLKMININFEVIPDDSPEVINDETLPEKIVGILAYNKCKNVSENLKSDAIVIAADTIVVVDRKVLGKPENEEHAFEMLSSLSGRTHEVYTGVSIIDTENGKNKTFFEKTEVTFKTLKKSDIDAYIKTTEPMDKAGAYGIQGLGSLFVTKINGDYFNVVGLPVSRVGKVLEDEFGLKILN